MVAGFPTKVPCNLDYTAYQISVDNDTYREAFSLYNANEATLTMIGSAKTRNTVGYAYAEDDDYTNAYTFLADQMIYSYNYTTDFRARTYALRTQCAPMTARCFPASDAYSPTQNYFYSSDFGLGSVGENYTFQCTPGFSGNVTSNGASLATNYRAESTAAAVGIGFSPDANLSRMVGNNESDPEIASYANPLHFGTWSLGWGKVPDEVTKAAWRNDSNIYVDAYGSYVWMLNCDTTIYDFTYDFINGTIMDNFTATVVKDQEIGGVVSYPFVAGLPIAQTCIEYASAEILDSANSTQLAEWWADQFSYCAVVMMAATFNKSAAILEQTRDNSYGATRVPIVPLYVLLGLKFLYCLAVLGLAIAAYQFTNPSESQSVKERLTVKGLAATCFCDANTHQQVAVQNVEQLFQSPKEAPDAEAATPPELKVGMVMTELGGWQFVKMAAGKVFNVVSPIVQADAMAVAKGGQFGADGVTAADWISMVKK